jgi:glycerol-3-phosphate dehydrogenase
VRIQFPAAMFDLAIIGGGINGCGIARDAAGRGLSVVLIEQNDLASATSSWSTKLIHGGLRYLEQYEFRLVRESLQEREVLLRLAPHLIQPMEFVLPHDGHMRPAWMIRAGLFLYDHLGGETSLATSKGVTFPDAEYSAGLRPSIRRGFVYSDAQVDDARLTVANALSARDEGAEILTRTKLIAATRNAERWELDVRPDQGPTHRLYARAVVNAAGPWVKQLLDGAFAIQTPASVKLVKGSHIVVNRVHDAAHAYLLQNPDGRVVFIIPYEGRYSLIGTTDVAVSDADTTPEASEDEIAYLLAAANQALAKPLVARDIVWRYAGVRPLYDDGEDNPSAITRDYVLKLDAPEHRLPLLSVFGGKLTTYRRLAEHAMQQLAPFFPNARGEWTATKPLSGGALDNAGSLTQYTRTLASSYNCLPADFVARLVRRHGDRAAQILSGVKRMSDLGECFGLGMNLLCEREIAYLLEHEWARSAEDVLWRRTKCGLHMEVAERLRAASFIEEKL